MIIVFALTSIILMIDGGLSLSNPIEENSFDCTAFTITPKKDYCLVPKSKISCYTSKAIEFRKKSGSFLPLWVQTCMFEVPVLFLEHQNDFDCSITIDGVVSCVVKTNLSDIAGATDFNRNCRFGLFYLTELSFPRGYYESLIQDGGKCEKTYLNVWSYEQSVLIAERYLSEEVILFSRTAEWKVLFKHVPGPWTTTKLAVLSLGLVILCVGILILFVVIRRKWKKYIDKIHLENHQVFGQVSSVMENSNVIIQEPCTTEEAPCPVNQQKDEQ